MGTRDPSRVRRVRHLRCDTPGWIAVVVCRKCGRIAALPYDRIVARFGELMEVGAALVYVRCSACGATCPEARSMRLCEPGCPRQRG